MNDAEEIAVAWLALIPETAGWTVAADKPQTEVDQFITVDRTAGSRAAMVLDRAEILIEVYSRESRLIAKNMALQIADRVPALEAFNDNVTRAEVNSLVHLDDTLSQLYRYQIYIDLYHRR